MKKRPIRRVPRPRLASRLRRSWPTPASSAEPDAAQAWVTIQLPGRVADECDAQSLLMPWLDSAHTRVAAYHVTTSQLDALVGGPIEAARAWADHLVEQLAAAAAERRVRRVHHYAVEVRAMEGRHPLEQFRRHFLSSGELPTGSCVIPVGTGLHVSMPRPPQGWRFPREAEEAIDLDDLTASDSGG